MQPSETSIAECLQAAFRPGEIASTDGVDDMRAGLDLKCAAVLVALAWRRNGWHLLFTRRTEAVEHHKGQVSFPGGACDPGESTPEQTALREAREEIDLDAGRVRLLGRLNDVVTITHYRVTPVVGVIPWPNHFRPQPAEVQRVFTIPLTWLARRENWQEKTFTPDGFEKAFPVLVYRPYAGELLWGVSARITHQFLQTLGLLTE